MATLKPEDYWIVVEPIDSEDNGRFYEAHFVEFGQDLLAVGYSQMEAIENLLEEAPSFFEDVLSTGQSLPEPKRRKPWDEYSGRTTVRISKRLHWELDTLSDELDISMSQFMAEGLQAWAELHKQPLLRSTAWQQARNYNASDPIRIPLPEGWTHGTEDQNAFVSGMESIKAVILRAGNS